LPQWEIYRKTGIARDTIRKYVREYENKAQQLGYSLTGVDKVDLIEDITKALNISLLKELKQQLPMRC